MRSMLSVLLLLLNFAGALDQCTKEDFRVSIDSGKHTTGNRLRHCMVDNLQWLTR